MLAPVSETEAKRVDQWHALRCTPDRWWCQHRDGWPDVGSTHRVCALVRPPQLVLPAHRRRLVELRECDRSTQRYWSLRLRLVSTMGGRYQRQLSQQSCAQQYNQQSNGEFCDLSVSLGLFMVDQDGGIVLFGSPGTIVENNTIFAEAVSMVQASKAWA